MTARVEGESEDIVEAKEASSAISLTVAILGGVIVVVVFSRGIMGGMYRSKVCRARPEGCARGERYGKTKSKVN